jgi:Tfp pilus assembly protein PilF
MKQWPWLILLPAVFGCINGAPLPPTPASSLAVIPTSNRAAQDTEYIELAQNYLRNEGKDPAQATYEVHRSLHHDDQTNDPDDGPATAAIVKVDFRNGAIWELEIKTNGDILRRADR